MVAPMPLLRAQIPPEVDLLIRAIQPLKNTGKDWTLGDIATEALILWLKQPENKALIERHNLLKALEDQGLSVDFYSEQK
uniref:Uncharacterized protein n=1 Tax=Oscillatoriales cyanobacterium SpSt-402 TaxID=2282168 RepID=A0A832H271_9CYAN